MYYIIMCSLIDVIFKQFNHFSYICVILLCSVHHYPLSLGNEKERKWQHKNPVAKHMALQNRKGTMVPVERNKGTIKYYTLTPDV